jgi:hypothetical protein
MLRANFPTLVPPNFCTTQPRLLLFLRRELDVTAEASLCPSERSVVLILQGLCSRVNWICELLEEFRKSHIFFPGDVTISVDPLVTSENAKIRLIEGHSGTAHISQLTTITIVPYLLGMYLTVQMSPLLCS